MSDLDLTAAVDAGAKAVPVDPDDGTCIIGYHPDGIPLWSVPTELARAVIEAALPEIRKALAPEVEQAVRDHQKPTIYGCPDQKLGTDYPKHVVEKWLESVGSGEPT